MPNDTEDLMKDDILDEDVTVYDVILAKWHHIANLKNEAFPVY